MQRIEYAVTTPTVSTVFHSKPRCRANMATLYTPTCSTCSERFPGSLSPKPIECLHFDLEPSCNLMCIYIVTDPCHIPPLAQARPMMLCIYTSKYTLLHELACNIASYCTSGRGIFTCHRRVKMQPTSEIIAICMLASYPGSRWAGKERAWYTLFAHAFNLPMIWGLRGIF